MGKNYEAWNIVVEDYFREKTSRDKLLFLVRFAVLAPSSHNAQPWRFVVSDATIDIVPDRDRAVPVSDPLEKNLFTALGCALENILVAADYYGLGTSVVYDPKGVHGVAARVSFVFPKEGGTCENKDHLIFSISKRRMNRNPYDPAKLPPEDFLKEIVEFSDVDVDLSLVMDDDLRKKIAKIVMDSRIKIFDDPSFRAEMAKYKKNNLTGSSVGITGNTMGFNTPMSLIAPFAIKHFNVLRSIQQKEEDIMSIFSPVHLMISTKKETQEAWMRSGGILQKIMLSASGRGIASGMSLLPPSTTDMQRLKEIFDNVSQPHIFVRMGYAEKIPPHAPRLRAEEVVD
jgi:nitroreductase